MPCTTRLGCGTPLLIANAEKGRSSCDVFIGRRVMLVVIGGTASSPIYTGSLGTGYLVSLLGRYGVV